MASPQKGSINSGRYRFGVRIYTTIRRQTYGRRQQQKMAENSAH